MASATALSFFVLSFAVLCFTAQAQNSTSRPASPKNLTAILEKGSQFTKLIDLLAKTQVGLQLDGQINNSVQGLTLLAPTDNAIKSLPAGTLNNLDEQRQVTLLQYHVLPQYYTLRDFLTVSNPVRTQASQYTVTITASESQVNVSTGLVQVQLQSPLTTTRPWAVYPIDKVLMPKDKFKPSDSPAPAPTSEGISKAKSSETTNTTAPSSKATSEGNTGFREKRVWWGFVAGISLISMAFIH